MASSYLQQTNINNFLKPFTISDDCPLENRETIHRILINLQNNFFKETKHIQQISFHRNHLAHYLPVILLGRDQHNKHYIFTLTDETKNKKTFYNFQNETKLSDMFRTFLKRHEEKQDRSKITAIPNTSYELLRNTIGYLDEQQRQIQSVNDRLRNDIINYNNWLTKIIELKTELKTATFDIIQIISEFTFLFWLDNFENINEKRIEVGETFHEEIENLNEELRHIWDGEYYSPHFESTLKVCSDSINYTQGLEDYVQIRDQEQLGSSSFSLSKTLTTTSTPKDVQINTSLQAKQKSTIKPDKPLNSKLFGNQQNVVDEINISDSDEKEKEIKFGNWIPPTLNQRVRKKTQQTMNQEYIRNNTYISSLNENNDNHDLHWDQQMYNYHDLKGEITEKVTNHTNKLIDNIENKFRQINENRERKQDEALQSMFNRFERTINEINIQYNTRTENRNVEDNSIQNNRHEIRSRRSTPSTTNSNTTEERETTVTEPPLPFYKQLTSMSINVETQIEQNISSGSVPTTIRPFDGTDPAYTVEEYLNSIVAAMIFSSGIEPVNKLGHHQWKVKRAALILHTLQGPAQKWYSTLPSETKLDWETFCKEFSDMFDSEKSKQQAKIVLQQLQKTCKRIITITCPEKRKTCQNSIFTIYRSLQKKCNESNIHKMFGQRNKNGSIERTCKP